MCGAKQLTIFGGANESASHCGGFCRADSSRIWQKGGSVGGESRWEERNVIKQYQVDALKEALLSTSSCGVGS